MEKPKILILTSKTGGGHESIAQAIKEGLKKKFKVEVHDGFPTFAARLYGYVHLFLPTFFNFGYKLTDNEPVAKILHLFSYFLVYPSLKKISFENYNLVFSVQPFLTEEFTRLIRKQRLAIFINDPISIHQVWICPKADLVFVATKEGRKLCLKKGLPKRKIVVSGFPVRQQFLKRLLEKESIRQGLGLKPNKFTVFVGGSGYGVRETKEVIKHLGEHSGSGRMDSPGVQMIVVCGRNKALQRELPCKKNLKIFGFVKNMAKMMKACDLIVGKAGPNLLFESIILGIPFLAVGPPPEQERGNMELIKKYKIGFVEENPREAARLIKKLAKNPKKLKKLALNIQKLRKLHQNAPKIIASEIAHLLLR